MTDKQRKGRKQLPPMSRAQLGEIKAVAVIKKGHPRGKENAHAS